VVAASSPPARLCAIAMKALAKAREHRYQTVEALRDDIEGFLRGGGWFAARHFQSGSLIIEEGEIGDRAYIVSEGTCEVFRTVGERTESLRVVGPGGVVGEVGLFTGARRVASTESEVRQSPKAWLDAAGSGPRREASVLRRLRRRGPRLAS